MRLASRGPVAADLDQAVLRLSPASAAAARRELEARLHGEGVEALRTLDLGLQGDTLGVFTLAWRRARTLNRNDEQMMSSLAAHASIAIQNARLFERLTLRRNELRRLARQQMHAEEEQRRGIARELHDELGQSLTALLIDARRRAAHGTASAPEWVQMAEELERVVASMREISYRLRPPMLDVLGLSESLRWLASSVSRHTSRPVSVQTSVSRRLAEPAELCLYRVAQEALTNAIRHSGASRISVRLREAEGQVWLSVTDDGCGFDAARNDRGKGLGLLVMRERVAELGGTFSVQSAPREGVRIEARLPSDDSAYRTNQSSAG
jgi:signal transduction histidine kinase